MNSNGYCGKTHLVSLDIKAGGHLKLYSLARNKMQISNITSDPIRYQAECKRSIKDRAYSCQRTNLMARSIISKHKKGIKDR